MTRTAELERANRQHWAHLDRFHKEAQEKNEHLIKTGDEFRCLRWVFEVRGEEFTRLQDRIVELYSHGDKLRHQLKEKSEDTEKSHRQFHETNQQLAKLQNRLAKEQREADEKNELVRRTEEMLVERQNRFVEKQREADKKGEPAKDRGNAGGTSSSGRSIAISPGRDEENSEGAQRQLGLSDWLHDCVVLSQRDREML
jgi:septal ring factor EnvC (AmiA/AmiB activator)